MAGNFDMRPHQDTWALFCGLMKWSLIGIIVVLVLMTIFIV